jgi:hypothetical protein
MSSKLKLITTRAKALYKTGKFAKWTDAIKEASKSLSHGKKVSGVKKAVKKVTKKKAVKKPSEQNILNKIHKVKKDVEKLDEAQHKHMSIGAIKSHALHHYKNKYGSLSTKKMLEKTKRGKAKLLKEMRDIENKIKKINSL